MKKTKESIIGVVPALPQDGVIHDSRVFRLGLVEERIKRVSAELDLFKLKVDIQLKEFITARDQELLGFTTKLYNLHKEDQQIRDVIAKDHNIDFKDYCWDDEVGILNKIGPQK